MNNIELTLLDESQLKSDSDEQLTLFKDRPNTVTGFATDFAILTSAKCRKCTGYTYSSCSYYLKTPVERGYSDRDVKIVTFDNSICYVYNNTPWNTIRPIIKLNDELKMKILHLLKRSNYNNFEILLGEYPQNVVNTELNNILESEYEKGNLMRTGNLYTTRVKINDDKSMQPLINYHEYIYDNHKYINILGGRENTNELLLDRQKIICGKPYWVEVAPVTWLIDNESNTLISKYCLLSGIRFDSSIKRYDGHFEETEIYQFMNTYMVKEMITDNNILLNSNENNVVNKPINYSSINRRMEEIKKRVKKLQERR